MNRIAKHEGDGATDEKCAHCRASKSSWEQRSCVWRDGPPRAVPASVFADLTIIGARAAEIRAEEKAAADAAAAAREKET